jgi:uncharacterized membrane protein
MQSNNTKNALNSALNKSVRERFLQALLFEVIAITLCAGVGAWLLGYPLVQMGALTTMISVIAMLWNMIINALMDAAERRFGFRRTVAVRALHALGFEIGLLLAIVPLAAWWLDMTLWNAFWLDIGVALFFMPYTFAYNWSYDKLRERIVARRAAAASASISAAPRPTR